MKKLFYSLFAMAMTAMTFTGCEDVPAPYDLPTNNGGGQVVTPGTPEGSGTMEVPFNVAAAHEFITTGEGLDNDVYVKGIIVSVKEIDTGTFGNATYYISDDGTSNNQLEVYRGLSLGNKKFTKSDEIKPGDEVIVCGRLVNYGGNTHEFTQGSYIYKLNGEEYKEEAGEAKGSGTLDDPYNSVAASQYASGFVSPAKSDKDVYIKGKVVSIAVDKNGVSQNYDAGFGNASFYISDDGTEKGQFYVYRALYLDNKEYVSGDLLKVGDEVVIYGKVTNYSGNTPETVQKEAYLYSLNGKTGEGGGGQPSADMGTKDNPITVAKAVEIINGMEDNATTEGEAYVKGKIVKITTTDENIVKYKNINYIISDDGTDNNTMTVYRGKNLNNTDFTKAGEINVGDEVVIVGKLQKYVNSKTGAMTPELAEGSYLVSLKSGSSSGGGGSEGGTISVNATDMGFAAQAVATSYTLSDGTKLTFAKGDGSNDPKYYDGDYAAVRMYAKNTLTIAANKKISKVIITTTKASGSTKYNGNDTAYADNDGTHVAISKADDTNATFAGLSANTVTIVNDHTGPTGGVQLRVASIEITYAE